jgi:hypothetical protein
MRGRGKEDHRGGGEDLWVLGSHILDLMRFFVGDATDCHAVVTQAGHQVTKADIVDGNEGLGPLAGDTITARYSFPNGVVGHFSSFRKQGGSPSRFVPYADLYRQSLERFSKPLQPIGIHSPGHVAESDEQAKEDIWPHYEGLMNRIGAERGWSPIGRAHFEREAGPEGALFVGSPQTVAAKIVRAVKALGLSRFDMKYSNGTLPHDKLMKSIELYGTKVAPLVRAELGG